MSATIAAAPPTAVTTMPNPTTPIPPSTFEDALNIVKSIDINPSITLKFAKSELRTLHLLKLLSLGSAPCADEVDQLLETFDNKTGEGDARKEEAKARYINIVRGKMGVKELRHKVRRED